MGININGMENQQLLAAVGRVLYGEDDDETQRESFEAAVAPYLSSDPHRRAFSSGAVMDIVNCPRNGLGALSDDEVLDVITTRLDHFRLPPLLDEDEDELDPQEAHNDDFATQIQLMKSTRVKEPFPKTLRDKFNKLEAIKDARMETPFSPVPIQCIGDDQVWADAISATGKAKNKSLLKGKRHDPEPLVHDIFKAEAKKQEETEEAEKRKKAARLQARVLLKQKAERKANGPIPEATLTKDDNDDRSDAQKKADMEELKRARELKKKLKAKAEVPKPHGSKRKASEDLAPLTKKPKVTPISVATKMREDPKLRSQPSVQLQDVIANPPSVESTDSVELLAIKRKPRPRPLSVASVSTSTLNISGQDDDADSADSDDELIPKRNVNIFKQRAKTADKKAKNAKEETAKAREENAKLRGQIRQQWDANKAERDKLQSSNDLLQQRVRELEEQNKVLTFKEPAKIANVAAIAENEDDEEPFVLPPFDGPFQWPMPAKTPGHQIQRLRYLDHHGYAEEDEDDDAEANDGAEEAEATSDEDEGVEEVEEAEAEEAEAEEDEDDEGIEDVQDSSDDSPEKQQTHDSTGSSGKLVVDEDRPPTPVEAPPKRKRSSDDNNEDEPSAKKGKANNDN